MYIEDLDKKDEWNKLKKIEHIKNSYQWKDTYFLIRYLFKWENAITVEEAMLIVENPFCL